MPFHLDFETRSRQELSDVGAYRYAECPDARILLAAISHDDEGPYLWVHPDYETGLLATDPRAESLLRRMVESEELIFAHNASFERAVTMFRGEDIGLTNIRPSRWRCTQAMARKAQIPDSLEMAAQTLGLDAQKDNKGKALIKKFSVPRDDGTFLMAADDPVAFAEFGEYCLQDVRVERGLHKRLAPFELSGIALEAFLLDIYLNDRGVPVNVPALQNASRILAECYVTANAEFRALTGLNPTQREKVRQWCNERGAALDNMQGPTLEAWLEKPDFDASKIDGGYPVEEWEDDCRDATRAVAMYADLNFAAAKKVDVMLACVNSDGVVRGTLLWHGAGTGRWSGRLIQPQNFKKPSIKDTEIAYRLICNGCTRDKLESLFGNPLEVIASCIRHFIHIPGKEMLDADYNAIECRDSNWLAGEEKVLKEFREGKDPYKRMAGTIFNRKPEEILNPSRERDLGKCAELGAGFGMGCKKFLDTCHKWGMTFVDEALAERAITGYRDSHPRIVKNWYEHNDAAKAAILQPGRWFNAGDRISYVVKQLSGMDFLLMRLPSGRTLSYPHPRIEQLAGDKKEGVTHWGKIKGITWGRCRLYGGKLAENCLSGDTGILTLRGWIRLDSLMALDRVFDGMEFVPHGGLLARGEQEIVDLHGVHATPDHHFFGVNGWVTAKEARQSPLTALWSFSYVQPTQTPVPSAPFAPTPADRHPPRSHDRYPATSRRRENHMGGAVRLREHSREKFLGLRKGDSVLLQGVPAVSPSHLGSDHHARNESPSGLCGMVFDDPALRYSAPCGISQLRGTGDNGVPTVVGQLRELLERYGLHVGGGSGDRPSEQQRELYPEELSLGASDRELPEQAPNARARLGLGCREGERDLPQHTLLENPSRGKAGDSMQQNPGCYRPVFDIRNCGPRNCFVVRSPSTGVMLLAHNCAQAVAADLMTYGACEARRQGFDLFTLIHDQAISVRKPGQTAEAYALALATLPPWAGGLPLKAEAKIVPFYKKG